MADANDIVSVVVLGNPNTGKSTLFNALTGVRQQTGNFPGVTVERRVGQLKSGSHRFEVIDLPGTYSLAPKSPEEMLTVNMLLGRPPASGQPDLILCVVDANNLERNLFLVSQVLDLHRPTVVAVNMIDVAKRHGLEIDFAGLSSQLGVPVVPVQANRKLGFEKLTAAMVATIQNEPEVAHDPFPPTISEPIERLQSVADRAGLDRFTTVRMLFDTSGLMAQRAKSEFGAPLFQALQHEQEEIQSDDDQSLAEIESRARYDWINQRLASFVSQSSPAPNVTWTDRVDAWLTHWFGGSILATVIMVFVFQLVFWAADPASDMIDWGKGLLSGLVDLVLSDGTLKSLIVDGLIEGVGSVLIFLPQILLLFFVLAILEGTGYLARAAFLMDKFLSRIGLSGITLFPLLSSFACAVPGIMATRVIRDDRERLITILIAPLMSCSARLPVYVLLIAAYVPAETYLGGVLGLQGLTMVAMYLVGIITAILVALALKATILKTGPSSFMLELPPYKVPNLRNVGRRVIDGGWSFVRDAGTMIVVVTIIVWAIGYFPRNDVASLPPALVADVEAVSQKTAELELVQDKSSPTATKLDQEIKAAKNRLAAYQLANSYLGRAGHAIEPIVKPLGWDWRIGCAAIASFPAREVIVSTMGVIFGLGGDVDEKSGSLREKLKSATWEGSDRRLFTLPVALSIMVFFALCAQCVSTLAVIRRETNSYRWPVFTFVYMTILAYVGAWATFQISDRIF